MKVAYKEINRKIYVYIYYKYMAMKIMYVNNELPPVKKK